MTTTTCLRCDWEGETDEPACPNCQGQSLYLVGVPLSTNVTTSAARPPEDARSTPSRITSAPSEPSPSTREPVDPTGRSAWSVVAVVVAVVVSVGALATWRDAQADRSAAAPSVGVAPSGSPPLPTPTGGVLPSSKVATPKMLTIAAGFMLALRRYDEAEAISLLADDGVMAQLMSDNKMNGIMPSVPLNRGQLALALRAERILGVQIRAPGGCQPILDPAEARGAQIRCSFVMHGRLRQIEGMSRVRTSINIRVRNGRIDRLSLPWLNVSWGPGGFHPVEFRGFLRWLEAEHPEAGGPQRGTVFRSLGQELVLILTRESLDLFARYLDEYESATIIGVPVRTVSRVVEGVRLSFQVPTSGWEAFGRISLNKSRMGPQGAEAMIYFPDVDTADPCGRVLTGPSATDLAAAVARAPGTELLDGPSDITLGGYPATRVTVSVLRRLGCDPGYFYAWKDKEQGALWPRTYVGDEIEVWIVDVGGTRLFIAGMTHPNAGAALRHEVREIVGSIRFD